MEKYSPGNDGNFQYVTYELMDKIKCDSFMNKIARSTIAGDFRCATVFMSLSPTCQMRAEGVSRILPGITAWVKRAI